jgi:hypothetical protein
MSEKGRVKLNSADLDNLNSAISSVTEGDERYGLIVRGACMARPETFKDRTVEQNKKLLEMFIARVSEADSSKIGK